jgi:hypothetical protein
VFCSPYPHVHSTEDVGRLHVTGGHKMLEGYGHCHAETQYPHLRCLLGDTVACLYTC